MEMKKEGHSGKVLVPDKQQLKKNTGLGDVVA